MTVKAEIEATATEADNAADAVEAVAPDAGEIAASEGQQAEQQSETGEDEGELVVSIGEEAPPQQEESRAPAWVRELRKQNRELAKAKKELEAKLQERDAPKQTELPPKPTLEGCDYDAEAFERKLADWYEAKRNHDAQQAEQQKAVERQKVHAEQRMTAYQEAKASIPADDMDEAEHTVANMLNPVQQQILIHGADNAAMLIYALGKHPEKAKQLAAIEDLAEFAFKAAKIEAELKVTKRKPNATPEKPITGTSGGISGSVDNQLERLREEAMRTGDFSKVHAYKMQLRNRAA